ncbi:FAD-binding protein [Desulfocucumis palustris]|uniref:FAD-binding protein n=1 Tax=Desulfocucumis palustris TaxID=1898651 RepID=UPI001E32475E|nr:FAD-binding protein [Desulfocucumis palustris]
MQKLSTDVLVIGGGAAAAMAALRANEKGAATLLMSKSSFPSGSSPMARSGFQAAVGHSDPADSPEIHCQDTLKVGGGLNNPGLVSRLSREIIRIVDDLEKWGIDLIKDGDKYAQRHRVGCTYPRHLHHYDRTGKALMQTLKQQVIKSGIPVMTGTMVIDLLAGDGCVCGALALDCNELKWLVVEAKSVVLATGGGGRIYATTDNPAGMTGDGYSMALRQGLLLIDMEMIEFQLSVCYPPSMNSYPPNSSAWVAAGARFYNGLGERFMKKHQPETLEKSSRAMINRAVGIEINEGRCTRNGGVYLDISSIPPEEIAQIGPSISRAFANKGVDLTYQPMELAPGAHTFLGGVLIREDCSTELSGLYAAGEVAGGVHGANRLGGNAVTDPLVFGDLAGTAAAAYASKHELKENTGMEAEKIFSLVRGWDEAAYGLSPKESIQKVQNIMSENVGLVRSGPKLEQAIARLEEMERTDLPGLSARGESNREVAINLKHCFDFRNMLLLGKAIAVSALGRAESRGTHYRQDFSENKGERWAKHAGIRLQDGKLKANFVDHNGEEVAIDQ